MDGITMVKPIHFAVAARGRRRLRAGQEPTVDAIDGRVPRVARLLALAIRFDRLIGEKGIRDQAALADLGHVTRARVTQIMNLKSLAPDIQEAILFLPVVEHQRDPIVERRLRRLCAELSWAKQRRMWRELAIQWRVPVGRLRPG